MINWISNKGPCTLVLSSFVLEPGFDLSLSHPQCKGKHLSVCWQQVVLLLKPSLKNLDLVWSKPHSASSCTISPGLTCVISILFHRPITVNVGLSTCIGYTIHILILHSTNCNMQFCITAMFSYDSYGLLFMDQKSSLCISIWVRCLGVLDNQNAVQVDWLINSK